jgi:transposase-like protein
MTTEERRRRRFSEEFKKAQVELIESGKATITQIGKMYQVKPDNVSRWVKKYGLRDLPKKIVISHGEEFDRIRELERENQKLLEQIGRQQVALVYKTELIRLAKERLGDDFEKK